MKLKSAVAAARNQMTQNRYPPGWDQQRVRKVLTHYEQQTEEEAAAEDEAAFKNPTQTVMEVPSRIVPAIRELIAKHQDQGTD